MSETRKLVAILVADVVGYSRLAGADEDRTLAHLPTAQQLASSSRAKRFPLWPNLWMAQERTLAKNLGSNESE
jgi:hypothetical protein